MRILYLAQQYDYGDPTRGYSFEHYNFYCSLVAMGHAVTYFDYPTKIAELGQRQANQALEAMVDRDAPDVLFAVVHTDLAAQQTLRRISQKSRTTTINWFCDDHWQFEALAKPWTPCFNHVVTTSLNAMTKYRAQGLTNVIKSQWGANHTMYKPTPNDEQYDVTFVGQPYGIRTQAVEALERAGIRVQTWGRGWPAGKLDQDEMIRVFSNSRINLNFADASSTGQTALQRLAKSRLVSSLRDKPMLWRGWQSAQRAAAWSKAIAEHNAPPPPRQIKGRVFEVPACGGFLLTQSAEDLADYLEPGVHCATFETIDDIVDQTRYYLEHEAERAAIAKAGYERTMREHRWADRLNAVFVAAGLETSNEQQAQAPQREAA